MIFTDGGGLTIDAINDGGITIDDAWGGSGLNIAAWTGAIENNSLKTLGWDNNRPVRVNDPDGLVVTGPISSEGHFKTPTIGNFDYTSTQRVNITPGSTTVLTRTCPFAGSIAVSCNFRTTTRFGAPLNSCTIWTNTTNPLDLISLDKTAQGPASAAGNCTIMLQNNGASDVCGELELQCWNPNG